MCQLDGILIFCHTTLYNHSCSLTQSRPTFCFCMLFQISSLGLFWYVNKKVVVFVSRCIVFAWQCFGKMDSKFTAMFTHALAPVNNLKQTKWRKQGFFLEIHPILFRSRSFGLIIVFGVLGYGLFGTGVSVFGLGSGLAGFGSWGWGLESCSYGDEWQNDNGDEIIGVHFFISTTCECDCVEPRHLIWFGLVVILSSWFLYEE